MQRPFLNTHQCVWGGAGWGEWRLVGASCLGSFGLQTYYHSGNYICQVFLFCVPYLVGIFIDHLAFLEQSFPNLQGNQ